ncbi:MAG: GIY-YIG nuclease family protein [candidate division Zixibacteria bacterium]|nr:GIY-YIG nuclease family protein [candidate division Zixibacteria bacterium]
MPMSYVYIMTNKRNTVLYTGVTADLARRVAQHKAGQGGDFTSRYRATKLVYFESFEDITLAIAREKQIKGGSRARKIYLVEKENPNWNDLSGEI